MNDSGLPPVANKNPGTGFSVTALVLGILSLILAWFYLVNISAIVFGIVGIVMAAIGRKKSIAAGAPTGLGTAGLVTSIIGLAVGAIGFISCTICVACAAKEVNDAANAINNYYY